MELLCIGLNHHTAPVGVRERFAVSPGRLAGEGRAVCGIEGVREVVVLSTCNRTEYYLACDARGVDERLVAALAASRGVGGSELAHLYQRRGGEVARHLFRVAGGLDSMVLGETEVFGQVKEAYAQALAAGLTGAALNRLFQRAFAVGKRLRRETSIQQGATSVGSVAVELAEKIFGRLNDSLVMVLGAGEVGRVTAQCLLSRGARSILVANRSFDRAAALAAEMGGEAVTFDQWPAVLERVDVVIASTGAPHAVMRRSQVEAVRRQRRYRPLFLIDIAVPRDIEPAVGEIEEVYLYDIDTLEQIAGEARARRHGQVAECERIIDEEVARLPLPAAAPPPGGSRPALRIGTRGSQLALAQAAIAEGTVAAAFPGMALTRHVIRTTGDRRTDVPPADPARHEAGLDRGAFVKELELALAAGTIDVAVHSLKDLPVLLDAGCELAAVLPRGPAGEVLVARAPGGLDGLADGAVVGTGSVRRARQLCWLRPGLRVADVRGNVPTRLAKLAAGEFDALLLAAAGLLRLGHPLERPFTVGGVTLHPELLDERRLLPAAGQGAIGLEIRRGDAAAAAVARAVNHEVTWLRVRAEREFLRLLGAGCSTPVGVSSELRCGRLVLAARVFSADGDAPRQGEVEALAGDPEGAARSLLDSLA